MKKYISVDAASSTSDGKVIFQNADSEFHGKVFSSLKQGDEPQDIRKLFIHQVTVKGKDGGGSEVRRDR